MIMEFERENNEPGTVDLQLTYPSSNRYDGVLVNLSATDRVSGVLLFELRMNGEQFATLLANRQVTVTGAKVTPNPGAIGKRAEHAAQEFRRGGNLSTEQAAEVWAANMRTMGWQSVRIRKTNFGHAGHAIRWEPTEGNAPQVAD